MTKAQGGCRENLDGECELHWKGNQGWLQVDGRPSLGHSAESDLSWPAKGWKGQNEVVPNFLVALSGKTFSGPLRAPDLQTLNSFGC